MIFCLGCCSFNNNNLPKKCRVLFSRKNNYDEIALKCVASYMVFGKFLYLNNYKVQIVALGKKKNLTIFWTFLVIFLWKRSLLLWFILCYICFKYQFELFIVILLSFLSHIAADLCLWKLKYVFGWLLEKKAKGCKLKIGKSQTWFVMRSVRLKMEFLGI